MSDEFDRRDWAEDLNEGIRNRDTWFRGLKILVLLLFLAVARFALIAIVIYQFCFCLVRNRPSDLARPVGPWLARYVELTILYVTWSSDYAPFPFAPLRDVTEDVGYAYEEPKPGFEEEEAGYDDEERYDSEPPAPPPGAEDALPEDEAAVAEDEALPEDESSDEGDDDQPKAPPRPDA